MKTALASLASLLALGAVAESQAVIHTWLGDNGGDHLGTEVSATGDVDQDGYPDVLLGAPYFFDVVGVVYVRSGRDGSTIHRNIGKFGMFAGVGLLGWSLDGGRDVDGDGVPDYIVGGLGASYYNYGTATVYAGATGEIIHREKSVGFGFGPGSQVLLIDDQDGDGRAEYSSSDHWADEIKVWNGLTGGLIYTSSESNKSYGYELSHIEDLSGDGRSDILVGAPVISPTPGFGEVHVVESQAGTSQLRLDAFEIGSHFGWSVASTDDFDGDGEQDILVGAPEAAQGEGRVHLFSSADGTLLMTLSGGPDKDAFGYDVAGDGDYDGDGTNDWAVGAPENDDRRLDGGKITVYSGVDGAVLATFLGDNPTGQLGFSLAWAGDVDQGGRDDLLAGAPFTPRGPGPKAIDAGQATIYRSEPDAGVYCEAKLNSQMCMPRLSSTGTPALSASSLRVAASQLINQQTGFLFWGTSGPLADPFMGGTKCVLSPVKRIPILTKGRTGPDNCTGKINVPFDSAYLAAQGLTPGQTVYTQLWYVDPAASKGVGLSDALRFDVLP